MHVWKSRLAWILVMNFRHRSYRNFLRHRGTRDSCWKCRMDSPFSLTVCWPEFWGGNPQAILGNFRQSQAISGNTVAQKERATTVFWPEAEACTPNWCAFSVSTVPDLHPGMVAYWVLRVLQRVHFRKDWELEHQVFRGNLWPNPPASW